MIGDGDDTPLLRSPDRPETTVHDAAKSAFKIGRSMQSSGA
jgi:hypothetical protein